MFRFRSDFLSATLGDLVEIGHCSTDSHRRWDGFILNHDDSVGNTLTTAEDATDRLLGES